MEDLMKTLVQTAEQPGTQQMLGNLANSLLSGGSQQQSGGGQGQAPVGQLLGALEQVIGGTPGSGNFSGGGGMNMSANDPIMMMLQPVVNQVAAKANLDPQIATVVASLAVHYLLSSHPASGSGNSSLSGLLGELSSGAVSQDTMHNSGMVNDVVKATGLSKADATKALDSTFSVLGGHVQGSGGGVKKSGGAKSAGGRSGR
jgi:hypothetical protein